SVSLLGVVERVTGLLNGGNNIQNRRTGKLSYVYCPWNSLEFRAAHLRNFLLEGNHVEFRQL
ncbi:MAG: hypothetical protein QME78_16205, partial [Thermodesulfobacteriota bacterium]|nr:hypothetical protein [Thermodesulfobacteriota bacterium]